MEEFTIYYGTPPGKDPKIGVDCSHPARINKQNIMDGQVLEVHTCVYEVSRREQELQREYGVRVDTIPYHVTYFKNKSLEQRAKISNTLMGNTNGLGNKGIPKSEEAKAKMSAANKGIPKSEEWKAKISAALTGMPKSEEWLIKVRVPKPKVPCPYCDKHMASCHIPKHIKAKHSNNE